MSFNCSICRDKGYLRYEYQVDRFADPVNMTEMCSCNNGYTDRDFSMAQQRCAEISVFGSKQEMINFIDTIHPQLQNKFKQMYGV